MKISFTHIRTPKQINGLCNMARIIWNEAYARMLSREQLDYMLELFFTPGVIEKQITQEGYDYRFIVENGIHAGFFGVCPRHEGDSLFLSKIYLLKEYRGKGLFEAAMDRIVFLARQDSLPTIRLHVNKNNHRAIKAYIRFGFHITESDVFDIGRGYVMDDHILEYVIPG
ncbi:MAG: GNAT family N-acetyltransferase [Bacteroidales bacterium]